MKRMFDLFGALFFALLAGPLILVIFLLVRTNLGKPILFRQPRPGLNGRPFKIYKFRTMADIYDDKGNLSHDSERIKPFGAILRKTSLDELPELVNVIKGDMSLVGPRPLLIQYLDLYTPEQARRHEVRPGITGWAQINGRNAITWEDKFKLDVWYVDNQSLLLDLKILFLTIVSVLKREGINQPGHVTSEEFMGTVQ